MSVNGSPRRRVLRATLVLTQVVFLSVSLLGPAFVSAAAPSDSPPPSAEPSNPPSSDPSPDPSPSAETSAAPTEAPTEAPSPVPTAEPQPTPAPTEAPTSEPTAAPTEAPTAEPTAVPATPQPATEPFIVTFANGVDAATAAGVLGGVRAVETGSIPVLHMHSILLPASSATAAVGTLRADPSVVRVDSDRVREAEATPNDTSYGDQWSLPKIGWDSVFGSVTPTGSAVVAVLDTGVDASHPDLAGQLVAGTSELDGSAGTTDPNGHGTAVAGIIGARTDNALGIAGIG